jgi:hypothetical protein
MFGPEFPIALESSGLGVCEEDLGTAALGSVTAATAPSRRFIGNERRNVAELH